MAHLDDAWIGADTAQAACCRWLASIFWVTYALSTRRSCCVASVCCHDSVALKEGSQVMVTDQAAGPDLDNWNFARADHFVQTRA